MPDVPEARRHVPPVAPVPPVPPVHPVPLPVPLPGQTRVWPVPVAENTAAATARRGGLDGARLPCVGTAAEPARHPEHQVYELPAPPGRVAALALAWPRL
ncbi:hypothetical protein [Streptomyces sp. NPDC002044]|uniref:hypothetical protein n=1 Tax=Streptomyces sp. NPDC002044 TaxID=3154662 RepID=UPI00331FB08E